MFKRTCGTSPAVRTLCALISSLLCLFPQSSRAQSAAAHERSAKPDNTRQRVIVLTDIGAEVDDTESMVRLLLYSDVIDIQGLIATTSTWKRASVSPELIQNLIRSYAQVRGNLLKHDANYPP